MQNASFSFDALGNLLSRSDAVNGQAAQSYGYDLLNRLITQNGSGIASYDAAGNLRSKSGVSSAYVYLAGTHKVQSAGGYVLEYDANGNVTRITGNGASKTLNYRQLNLPESIVAEGNTLSYLYDGAHARIKETVSTNQGTSSTYYLGGFELHTRSDGVVEERHYLSTPEGAVGIHTRRSSGVHDTRYWFKDHLGSIVAITDAAGSVKARYAYDAWGKRSTTFGGEGEERGFTGHEHLIEAGLIHMNGRLYFEPLGRMLQADPIIQEPLDGQNYNRYSYVLNNPLAFTDPTGFSTWTRIRAPVAAIIISILTYGAASAAVMNAYGVAQTAATMTAVAGTQISTAFAASVMSSGIAGMSVGTIAGVVGGAAAGFAAGGIMGGNIESALYGAFTGAVMGGVGGLVGDSSLPVRIGAKAATSAALAYVQGGDWRRAARFAAFAELGQAGWAYTRDQTDTLYAAACAREGNCSYDTFGKSTDGGRNVVRTISPEEMDRVPGPISSFLEGGMSMEGQPHMYTPGQPFCNAIGDALCGAVRGFVRQVSKPHDWGNSWSYDKDPSSLTYGYRIEGGGLSSLSARVAYEVGVQAWSLSTMPVMAGCTAFALYGDYFNPSLYGVRGPH